jgi:hypothetical protein
MKSIARSMRRAIGRTPMQGVIRELNMRGFPLATRNCLEVFGGTGERHTIDYGGRTGSLEIWEIQPGNVRALRQRFPTATVEMVDSYEQVRTTERHFDCVVVDNPPFGVFGDHCEHFDLLPDLFRVLNDEAVLILNVIPDLTLLDTKVTRLEEHRRRRAAFYGAPGDHISLTHMAEVYVAIARASGFDVEWWSARRRGVVWYLTLKVRRHMQSPQVRAERGRMRSVHART